MTSIAPLPFLCNHSPANGLVTVELEELEEPEEPEEPDEPEEPELVEAAVTSNLAVLPTVPPVDVVQVRVKVSVPTAVVLTDCVPLTC